MPNLLDARIRHAFLYLQKLDSANDRYLTGENEVASALLDFDYNQSNIYLAQKWLAEYSHDIDEEQIKTDDIAHIIVDLCNAYPDAGAYLISLRLAPKERIRWLQAALRASQQLGNDITTQAHLGNLGLAYDELGDFPRAIQYLEKALQLAEHIGDHHHEGAWLGNLGNIYAALGEHATAITFHERHLAIARANNDDGSESHALANIGVSLAYLGQSENALKHYQQARELAVKRRDRHDESLTLLNIGLAYYDLDDLEAATIALRSAYEICTELGDTLTQALIMGGLADINIERKNYPDAIQTLLQALDLLYKNHPDIQAELRLLQSLGNAYTASSNYPQALGVYLRQYKLAESVGAKASVCSAFANQTSIHRAMGNLDLAIDCAQKGLKLARDLGSLSNESFIRWQLGLIYEAQGAKEKAQSEFEGAIHIEARIHGHNLESHIQYLKQFKSSIQGEQ